MVTTVRFIIDIVTTVMVIINMVIQASSESLIIFSFNAAFNRQAILPFLQFLQKHKWRGHVNNIDTMQFLTGIPRNSQSRSYMPSLTECVWKSQKYCIVGYYLICPIEKTHRHTNSVSWRPKLSSIVEQNLYSVSTQHLWNDNSWLAQTGSL